MPASTARAALVGAVLALWMIAALWALVTGLILRRRARETARDVDRLTALIDGAPSLPIVVRADGQVEASPRLASWLDLPRDPHFLTDLAADGRGLSREDANALEAQVKASQRTASRFVRAVQPIGGARRLLLHGGPASPEVAGPGGVVLWAHDLTDSQNEIARLNVEVARLSTAFEAVSQLIEAAPIPMWHRSPDLRLTLVNAAYVSAVDAASAKDVVARGLELIEPAGGVTPIAAAAAARESGQPLSRSVPATIAGKRRSMRVVDVPLAEAGVAGFAIDNDELDRARADVRRFGDAQRVMLDRLSAGVAQFAADRTLSFSNLPFQRSFALRPEWLTDRPEFERVLERMREAGRLPDVRDFPAWKAERSAWFASGDPIEESWALTDGAHLRVVAQPVPDGGLLLVFEDRTEQLQLSSARDTLLRVRAATFDNLFEALGVFGADGRLTLWNNRFREAWGFDEMLLAGHPRVDTLAEAAAGVLTTPGRAALIRDVVRSATLERRSRSGRVAMKDGRHFEFAAVPLPDGNALFTMLDVTDSRRVERALRERAGALEEADRAKTAFVANMSHDLRTPLTSIGGFAEMLALGYAGELGDRAKAYVDAILESVARLGGFVDEVLRLTQVDAGLAAVDRETVDLLQVVEAAVAGFDASASAKSIDLALDLHLSVGRVEGDPKRLREAVERLLDNAIRYTPAGGRVSVHGSGTVDAATIVVSDNGPGMGEAVRARTLANPNVDAGVPFAAHAVGAHGGTLTLLSEPGQGTAVRIELRR